MKELAMRNVFAFFKEQMSKKITQIHEDYEAEISYNMQKAMLPSPLFDRFLTIEDLNEHLKKGVNLNQVLENGSTPLHILVLNSYRIEDKLTLIFSAPYALKADTVNTKLKDEFGNTPLHILIANEEFRQGLLFIYLAGDKLDYRVQDAEGKTALILAAKMDSNITSFLLVELIKHAGDDKKHIERVLNCQDNKGNTVLHYACIYRNQRLIDELIAAGADTSILNSAGNSPLESTEATLKEVSSLLAEVAIDPTRDCCASANTFIDNNLQPITDLEENFLEIKQNKNELVATELAKLRSISLLDFDKIARTGKFITRPMSDKDKNLLIESLMTQYESFEGKSIAEKICERTLSFMPKGRPGF